MDLDNIIYIVATIVLFVVSIIGQSKKKKVQAPVPQTEDEVVYSLDDFEKILERKKEFRQDEPEATVHTDIEESEKHEKKPDLTPTSLNLEHKKNDQQEETENNDGFDVKSAIIYSSILERKKFRH